MPHNFSFLRVMVLCAVLLGAFGVYTESRADTPNSVQVRIGEHNLYTRIVIETAKPVPYRFFSLAEPARLVIDLPPIDVSKANAIGSGKALVGNYRIGRFSPAITRVVIDTNENFTLKNFFNLMPSDNNGFRLIFDIATAEITENFLRTPRPWESYIAQWEATMAMRAPIPPHHYRSPDDLPLIVIDAGHGGVDPGAIGKFGSLEKDLTLAGARQIRDILKRSGRYRVLLTRERDVYVPLRKRFQIAENAHAVLFISIHADAIESGDVRGASVYTLSETASDEESQRLARRENAADSNAGQSLSLYNPEIAQILFDMEQRSTMSQAARLAGQIVDTMRRNKNIKLLNNPHRFAGFAVLKSPSVPSILIEMGFLSNRQEEKLLNTAQFQKQIAETLLKAIDAHLQRQTL